MNLNLPRFTVFLFLLLPASWCAAAQPPDMTKPPTVGPVKPYQPLPRVEYRLANGLQVLLVSDRRYPLVNARLAILRGDSTLTAKEAGTLDALTELLTEGTQTKDAKQIAEEADALGGNIYAYSRPDFMLVGSSALSENTDRMFRLLREVALQPTFPEAEVALRKENMLEELKVNRSEPSFLASVAFDKRLFDGHAYAITAPTEESIAVINRARLAELHKNLFLPNISILVLVGDFDPKAIQADVQEHFGSWQRGNIPDLQTRTLASPPKRKVYLLDRPGSAQSELRLGNLTIREKDHGYFPLLVVNTVLGGSFASRLVSDIREKRGYAYRIRTSLSSRQELGNFGLVTSVRTEVTADALKAILEHFDRIRSEAVTEDELQQAKNMLAGRFVRGMETQEGVADEFLNLKIYGLPSDYLETYVKNIQEVTREEALLAARRYILPDHLVIMTVGDAAKIEKNLTFLSPEPIRRVDSNGDIAKTQVLRPTP